MATSGSYNPPAGAGAPYPVYATVATGTAPNETFTRTQFMARASATGGTEWTSDGSTWTASAPSGTLAVGLIPVNVGDPIDEIVVNGTPQTFTNVRSFNVTARGGDVTISLNGGPAKTILNGESKAWDEINFATFVVTAVNPGTTASVAGVTGS